MSKPLVHQITERARGFIADPRKWTQYAIARTGIPEVNAMTEGFLTRE